MPPDSRRVPETRSAFRIIEPFKEEPPDPELASFCISMFGPLTWGGARPELEPAAFVPGTPLFPALGIEVRTEIAPDAEVLPGRELAIVRTGAPPSPDTGVAFRPTRTPEILPGALSLWTGTQEPSLHQAQVMAAEVRSSFCLGPAGVIQVITAVILVKDESVSTPNISEDPTVSLGNLLAALGHSVAPSGETVATARKSKVTKKKAGTGPVCTHAPPAPPQEDKPVKKRTRRPKKAG